MASKQPVRNIAIVGASGTIGSRIVQALLEKGQHHVTALVRPGSASPLPTDINEAITVDQTDHTALVTALSGQDALVITVAPAQDPLRTQKPLIDAAVSAGVRYIMPNEYSYDMTNSSLARDTMMGVGAQEVRQYIEEAGKGNTFWIGMCCGFWYEFSLTGGEVRFGFDLPNKKLTLIDDGNTKICTTTWWQCARSIARVLALPEAELKGFRNSAIFVASFTVSQREMLASVLRVTGGSESDWTISHEASGERYSAAAERVKSGDISAMPLMVYTRVFFPNGGGDHSDRVVNEQLGLPKEHLDVATREGLELSAAGFWDQRRADIAAMAAK